MDSILKLIVAATAAMVVDPSALDAASASDFVNPQVCARCHSEIAKSYARTGMGRSFFRPTAANSPELAFKNTAPPADQIAVFKDILAAAQKPYKK